MLVWPGSCFICTDCLFLNIGWPFRQLSNRFIRVFECLNTVYAPDVHSIYTPYKYVVNGGLKALQ